MSDAAVRRWRLALGRHAQGALGRLEGRDEAADRVLSFLYDREQRSRGGAPAGGGLDPTQMVAIDWLGAAQTLFPKSVFATLQSHALDRYELTELLQDPHTLDRLKPSPELLKLLLRFHGRAQPELREKLRSVAAAVIADIVRRLRAQVQRALSGRRNRFRRSRAPSAANFDARSTIRANLATYDPARHRLIAERLYFYSRERRRLPWRIILCVDQSGSMTTSLIHAAVMAAILSGLQSVQVKMVLFDTSIIDVSDRLTDPLETLLSVQLGGGTNIGGAVAYCETLISNPERTILALISDFCEGAPLRPLYAAVARLAEARVKLIGLAALDDAGPVGMDREVAAKLAALGMHIAALTPDRFDWIADILR